METAVVLLLGNRDIQIHKNKFEDVVQKYSKFFVPNKDGGDTHFIVDKFDANKNDLSFLQITELIWQNYDYFKNVIEYTLWNLTFEILQNRKVTIDKIYISTSKQEPPNVQDSYFIAYAIQKYLIEEGFEVELRLCDKNPTDFEEMTNFYIHLFDEISLEYDKIFISNTGGTPQMRTASHFAGIFKDFEYISVSSTQKTATNTFKKQENQILRQIIEKMLAVYDYTGIDDLPINQIVIKHLSKYAMSRIHLDFDQAFNDLNLLDDNEDAFLEKIKNEVANTFDIRGLERELFLSAKIKFHQKAYADYLWRLFTIQDNLLIPILESYFQSKIIYNKPNHLEWNELLSKHPDITNKLDEIKIGSEPLDYSYPNKFAYKQIYKIITNDNPDILVDSIDRILSTLGDLRNSIAHNYGSIGRNDLNKTIPVKPLRKALKILYPNVSEKDLEQKIKDEEKVVLFNQIFNFYLKIEVTDFGIYDEINKKIISLL